MLAVDHSQNRDPSRRKTMPMICEPSAVAILSHQIGQASPDGQRKGMVGEVGVDLRVYKTQTLFRVAATTTLVHVIVPVSGAVIVVSSKETQRIAPGSALLFADRDRADCTWLAGSMGLILHISRKAVQAQNFVAGGGPRRLTACTFPFDCGDPDRGLGAGLVALGAAASVQFSDKEESAAAGAALIAGLAEALSQSSRRDDIFPMVASVKGAIDRMCESPIAITLQELASAAGITLPVLQRNVRDHTGATLAKLLLDARLDWARECLGSQTELRAVADLARITGHRTAAVFIRAYHRRFGETPTQTRARLFARY